MRGWLIEIERFSPRFEIALCGGLAVAIIGAMVGGFLVVLEVLR